MKQLATLLGVGRSYTSRVIQTFKAEGVLETRRGSILVRNRDALRIRACLCNESVKNHFEEVLRGVYPTEEEQGPEAGRVRCENQLTKSQNNALFSGDS